MIDWRPAYEGEPQQRAEIAGIVSMTAGANNNGKTRSPDGRDKTGLFPWAAWAGTRGAYRSAYADTLDDAKRAAIRAAKQILTAALDECGDD